MIVPRPTCAKVVMVTNDLIVVYPQLSLSLWSHRAWWPYRHFLFALWQACCEFMRSPVKGSQDASEIVGQASHDVGVGVGVVTGVGDAPDEPRTVELGMGFGVKVMMKTVEGVGRAELSCFSCLQRLH